MAHREPVQIPARPIQIRFEPGRTASAFMVHAYEQLVPPPLRQSTQHQRPAPLLHSPQSKGGEQ